MTSWISNSKHEYYAWFIDPQTFTLEIHKLPEHMPVPPPMSELDMKDTEMDMLKWLIGELPKLTMRRRWEVNQIAKTPHWL